MIYRLLFAFRMWSRVQGMPIWTALAYPIDRKTFPDMGPIELADEEISCTRDTA